ncbi:MAG TPA: hypothetical protein VFX11_13665, partial [Candidatus Kapabacteria bacterium]|nr:hypothetical protein [Candidatus Kapabacteria bacterium]
MLQNIRKFAALHGILIVALVLSSFAGLSPVDNVQAQTAPPANFTPRRMSPDLMAVPFTDKTDIKVLVQVNGPISPELHAFLTYNEKDIKLEAKFVNFPILAGKVSTAGLAGLLNFPEVHYVSLRKQLKQLGHVTETTGAASARAAFGNGLTTETTLDGKGIGVAVIDSGIDKGQKSFTNNGTNNVVFKKNFIATETTTNDLY